MNGDFYPAVRLEQPARPMSAPFECGPLSNLNFGKVNPTATQFDKEVLEGWGVRPYNWSVSAGVQHQIASGASVDVGYFRRWYGNFTVVDNQLVDARGLRSVLRHGAAQRFAAAERRQQICGFYDIKPAKNGRSQNLVRLAKHYGEQTEVYNGVDASMNWRVKGLTLFGGLSTGRTATASASSSTCLPLPDDRACAATAATAEPMANCEVVPPFLTQYKGYGVYQLPWGVSLSGTYQAVPQPEQRRGTDVISAPTTWRPTPRSGRRSDATLRPAPMARRRSSCSSRSRCSADTPSSSICASASLLAPAATARARLSLDIYNVFNSNDWQTINTRLSSNRGGQPLAAADADPAGAVLPARDADRFLARDVTERPVSRPASPRGSVSRKVLGAYPFIR